MLNSYADFLMTVLLTSKRTSEPSPSSLISSDGPAQGDGDNVKCECIIKNLSKGKPYEIIVWARNDAGLGYREKFGPIICQDLLIHSNNNIPNHMVHKATLIGTNEIHSVIVVSRILHNKTCHNKAQIIPKIPQLGRIVETLVLNDIPKPQITLLKM